MRPRPPQSATSRHYAEPIPATGGDYDDLDGDYDLAGRDSNDVDEGYVHRVRPRRTSDMSISVQGPPAPQRVPAPPYRRAAAARVAAQREDSSDLAPEHPTRITPRNRSSTGSLRSAPRTSTGSGDHLARFETGDY